MEMLKLFAKIVFNPATDGSFQMCGKDGNYYYFMQCKVCDATYIFRIDRSEERRVGKECM